MNIDKMNPIRILQVLTTMNRGGAETMVMNYYRAIDRTKIQFDFLLHRDEKGDFDDEIRALGGKIYTVPAISPKNYIKYIKAINVFFDEHPEYKVVHSHLNALSGILLQVAKNKGINCRIAHSHLAVTPFILKKIFYRDTDIKATIKDSIQTLIRFKVQNNASDYFACSKKAGDWLYGKRNANKVRVINNAIDASMFTYHPSKAKKIKESLNLQGKIVIGHVGRFNEQKNHFFLIKIFKELVSLNNKYMLVLVGIGNLQPLIIKEIQRLQLEKNIILLGLRTDIPDLLQAFDAFLMPSLYEGLPVTLIEAQASGLKILASDTVTEEVNITDLVTFCSLRSSEKEWARLLNDNINYKRRNTFQEIVEGNYDIYNNAKNLQNFYLKTLS